MSTALRDKAVLLMQVEAARIYKVFPYSSITVRSTDVRSILLSMYIHFNGHSMARHSAVDVDLACMEEGYRRATVDELLRAISLDLLNQ